MPKTKDKKYYQKYTKAWEIDSLLKDWISPDPMDDSVAICKCCRANLKAHKKDLLAHVDTDKHKKTVKADRTAKSCQKLSSIFIPIYPEKTKIAELKIAAFIAEHASIQTVDHMTEILPQLVILTHYLK